MTLPLGLAENSIQLVPDGTLILHVLIILVMVYVLNATLFKPILFNFAPAPSSDRIERAVCIAVKTFMAAHRAPARS